jgi:hypothetical protein
MLRGYRGECGHWRENRDDVPAGTESEYPVQMTVEGAAGYAAGARARQRAEVRRHRLRRRMRPMLERAHTESDSLHLDRPDNGVECAPVRAKVVDRRPAAKDLQARLRGGDATAPRRVGTRDEWELEEPEDDAASTLVGSMHGAIVRKGWHEGGGGMARWDGTRQRSQHCAVPPHTATQRCNPPV